MRAKSLVLVILLAAIALILVILALQLLVPGDRLELTEGNDAHILFSADQAMVIAPGGCVTVRWQVDFVPATITLEKHEVPSHGFASVCVDNQSMPLLHVAYQGSGPQDYRLHVEFWVEQPATWLLGGLALLLGLISLWLALNRSFVWDVRRTSRRLLVFAGVGLLVTLLAIVGLLVEVSARFYFEQFGTAQEKATYLYSRHEIVTQTSGSIPLPFVVFGSSSDYPGHNSLGYRGDALQIPKPAGVYRIVVLGDSSTYGTKVPYNQTYAYNLQQILRSDYGYQNVEVVNAGVPTYSSWNLVMDLAFRIPTLQPDLVIIYQGWIDVLERQVSPDCYAEPSPYLGLDPNHEIRWEPGEISPSVLYRLLAVHFGWMDDPATNSAVLVQSPPACNTYSDDWVKLAENIQANPPTYFERNLREEIALTRANNAKLILMTWAYNPLSPELPLYRLSGIAEHNAITRRVALDQGVPLYDYAPTAPLDQADWADADHMSAAGNLLFAQKLAKFLTDHALITP